MSQDYSFNLTSEETIVTITSPNFPNNYFNDEDILWQVIAPTGFRVMVQFTDFNLEWFSDTLSVYHGLTNSFKDTTQRALLSGSSLPDNISSIGSYLWLWFKTDSIGRRSGFSLMVSAEQTVIINLTSEGTIVTITSPNYPTNYDNNLDILWHVIAPTCFRVMVQFNDFKLSSGDSLSVYHGLTNSWTDAILRAYLYESSLPENISSIGSYLWLWFKTDSTWRWKGFSLMVSAVKPENNVDILWQVRAPTGLRVMVQFNDFDLGPQDTNDTYHGSLTVYHALTNSLEDATQRASLSGSSLPDNISSIGSFMWLWFTSDGSVTGKGFSLMVSAVEPASSSTIIMNTTALQTTTPESTQSDVSSKGPTLALTPSDAIGPDIHVTSVPGTSGPISIATSTATSSASPTVQTRLGLISALASLSAIAILVVIVCLVCRQKRLKHVSSQGIATSGEPRESPGIKDNPTFESSIVHDLRKSDVADCPGGNDPYIALTTPHDGPTFQVYEPLREVDSQGDGYEVPINGANGQTGPEYDKNLHKFQVHPETDYEITHEYQDITNNVVARNNLNNESPVCGLQEHPETDYGITHEYQDPGIVGTNIPQYESQVQPETDYEAIHEYEDPSIIGKSIPQYESHIIGPTM